MATALPASRWQPLTHLAAGIAALYCLERVAAALALILLFPLMVLVAAVTAAVSKRFPLVEHTRVGLNGATLHLLKFRTMWDGNKRRSPWFSVERVGNAPSDIKDAGDPRIPNAFAAFCRRYSLDEMPQLYHVVRGEMSLVGPRPITQQELDRHYGLCQHEVLSLRPGLTGLWQVRGRSRLTYATRRRLDLIFVRRASAGLYLRILLLSVPRVLRGDGAF